MIHSKKSVFITLFLLICIVSIFLIFKGNPSVNGIENRLEPSSNKLGLGMYGKDEKIIDNGSILDINDGKIDTKISLSHFMNIDRKYKLLVLNDFRQTEFDVNGVKKSSHDFNAKANTTSEIDIINEANNDTKEASYLIIKQPDSLIEKFEPEPVLSMTQILSLRYTINSNDIEFQESISPLYTSNEGPIDTVFLSKSKDEFDSALISAKSGEKVYLTVGNINDEITNYALIALLDWEQVPLIDDNYVHFVSVNPGEKKVFEYTLPETNYKKNYQILVFPSPYNVSPKNYQSHFVEATMRTVIQPQ